MKSFAFLIIIISVFIIGCKKEDNIPQRIEEKLYPLKYSGVAAINRIRKKDGSLKDITGGENRATIAVYLWEKNKVAIDEDTFYYISANLYQKDSTSLVFEDYVNQDDSSVIKKKNLNIEYNRYGTLYDTNVVIKYSRI